MVRDGFSAAWSSWYESIIKSWGIFLDDGWNRNSLNNRVELKKQLEEEERIAYLENNYPGDFASIMRKDYDRVIECLRGKRYELSDDDLAYRELGEQRVEIATLQAATDWQEFKEKAKDQLVDTYPAVEIDDRKSVVGKLVELPWTTPRQIINDLGSTYAVFGSRYDGYYFIDFESSQAQRFFDVFYRYRRLVNSSARERYSFFCEILDEPRMITYREQPVTGLLVEMKAGKAGEGEGEMFVDLSDDGPDLFSAESELKSLVEIGELSDDLSPEGVIDVMIRCVQQVDIETWKKTFADWRAWARRNGEIFINRSYGLPDHVFSRPFERSRQNLLKRTYDSRVSKVSPVITLAEANVEFGTPRVQEVHVFVDHIGLFDGEYRSFNDVNVTRPWTLQRLDDGPWRITDVKSL